MIRVVLALELVQTAVVVVAAVVVVRAVRRLGRAFGGRVSTEEEA